MVNSEYYKNLFLEKFPKYNIDVEDVKDITFGTININEGVKIVISKDGLKEPLVDSYQVIKGNNRDTTFDFSTEEAVYLILSSVENTIEVYEDSLKEKSE
jgi:hypothetical protein